MINIEQELLEVMKFIICVNNRAQRTWIS